MILMSFLRCLMNIDNPQPGFSLLYILFFLLFVSSNRLHVYPVCCRCCSHGGRQRQKKWLFCNLSVLYCFSQLKRKRFLLSKIEKMYTVLFWNECNLLSCATCCMGPVISRSNLEGASQRMVDSSLWGSGGGVLKKKKRN